MPDVNRAQSEIIGSLLLVGTVVILMTVVGYYGLGQIGPDEGPTAVIDATVTDDSVTFSHGSGDPIPGDELTVVLRYDGTEQRYDFDARGNYGDDDVFDPGEQWTFSRLVPYDESDDVEVILIHDPSGTVLFHGQKVAATPTPTSTSAPAAAVDPVRYPTATGPGPE